MLRFDGNRKKRWGNAAHLPFFVALSSSRLIPASLKSKRSVERTRPASENRQLLGVRSRFPGKTNIVTTVFWIGEEPGGNNLVPNRTSAWDKQWTKSYGGFDDPDPAHRRNYAPMKFTPQQNPFYRALPYNDKAHTGHRPEASRVVPWFQEATRGRLFPLARTDGWRSAKAIESLLRSGKTQDHFERTIGNTCLAMNVRNPI